MPAIGKLERVELRKLWEHEATAFTPWLAEHLEVLSEHINYKVSALEKEKSVGAFSADLFAEGPNGETVVIENQLGQTDHDHLGKVLVYLTNLGAKSAIWISSNPRPEHVAAVEWLNEVSPPDTAFFLVRLEAYQIGGPPAAPLFTVVTGPSAEAKERGQKKEELAERQIKRQTFWTQLLDKARERTQLHANISPGTDSWVAAGAGKYGMMWSYTIRMKEGGVELYIDRGPDKKDETDGFFDQLHMHREQIDESFGEPLLWDRVDGRRGVRIKSESKIGGWRDEDQWEETQDDLVDRMVRLEAALRPFIKKLK